MGGVAHSATFAWLQLCMLLCCTHCCHHGVCFGCLRQWCRFCGADAVAAQVNVAPGGMLLLRGVPYTLLQYHFHAPAEHAVDGTRAAMEAHLVHRSDAGGDVLCGLGAEVGGWGRCAAEAAQLSEPMLPCRATPAPASALYSTAVGLRPGMLAWYACSCAACDATAAAAGAGDLAVLGVQLQPTAEEAVPGLAVALQHAPAEAGQTVPCPVPVRPSSLLPAAALSAAPAGAMRGSGAAGVLSRYVHYSGSLTTPPCSEGVDWIVLGDPLPVTQQQVREVGTGEGGRACTLHACRAVGRTCGRSCLSCLGSLPCGSIGSAFTNRMG